MVTQCSVLLLIVPRSSLEVKYLGPHGAHTLGSLFHLLLCWFI